MPQPETSSAAFELLAQEGDFVLAAPGQQPDNSQFMYMVLAPELDAFPYEPEVCMAAAKTANLIQGMQLSYKTSPEPCFVLTAPKQWSIWGRKKAESVLKIFCGN
ncbi:MAG: hypothetical protein HC848_05375 [Limnobacter sp.]|nr:hypothetical protein [Limnobacter sp.]